MLRRFLLAAVLFVVLLVAFVAHRISVVELAAATSVQGSPAQLALLIIVFVSEWPGLVSWIAAANGTERFKRGPNGVRLRIGLFALLEAVANCVLVVVTLPACNKFEAFVVLQGNLVLHAITLTLSSIRKNGFTSAIIVPIVSTQASDLVH
jgi:hypothetical protein